MKPGVAGQRRAAFRGTGSAERARVHELERRLGDALARSADLLDTTAEGIFEAAADGRLVFANRAFARILGFGSVEELMARLDDPERLFADPEQRRAIRRTLAERGRVDDARIQIVRVDGTRGVASLSAVTVDGEPDVAFRGFVLDITERERSEQALRDAEERYRTMVEQLPAITYVDDYFEGSGGLLFVSPQIEPIMGFTPEEWIEDKDFWWNHAHPDDRDAVDVLDKRAREDGTSFEAEYRMVARGGRVVWFLDRANVIRDAAGTPFLVHGVMLDITEQKRAEEALRRRESILEAVGFAADRLLRARAWEEAIDAVLARLGKAAGVSRVYVFENHLDDDGRLLTSPRFEWVADGVEPQIENEELQGIPYRAAGFGRWVDVLGDGGVIHGLVRGFPDSERDLLEAQSIRSMVLVPIEVAGEWWGLIGFDDCAEGRDWSAAEIDALKVAADAIGAAIDRASAQGALLESEERFRRLAERAPDVIFRYRLAPEPALEYASPAVEAMTGYSVDRLLAQPGLLFELIHPDDTHLLDELLADPERGHTLRWIHADGRVVWTEQRSSPVLDEGGRIVAWEGIARDVTERVRAQERLQASYDALRGADEQRRRLLARLVRAQEEERQRIALDIHDDSIQVMTAVGMRLQLLHRALTDPEDVAALVNAQETVQLTIQRLRHLLFELHPPSLDRVGLSAALVDHSRLIEDEGGPQVSIEDRMRVEPPPGSRTIAYRIAQEALVNVRKHARASRVGILLEDDRDGTRVTIRDDGVGFDPDATPANGTPGHLGIASMLERAQLAGGWCRVDSAPGQGTTVAFWVPSITAASSPQEGTGTAGP